MTPGRMVVSLSSQLRHIISAPGAPSPSDPVPLLRGSEKPWPSLSHTPLAARSGASSSSFHARKRRNAAAKIAGGQGTPSPIAVVEPEENGGVRQDPVAVESFAIWSRPQCSGFPAVCGLVQDKN